MLALSVATALVLLIACTNVAGLLLARGVTRQRTLAIYAALGARRGRLVRYLLTESVVLGLGGGAIGLAAAALVVRVVPALVPGDIARLHDVGVDGAVMAFTFGLSVVVGLAFGAVPAFQSSRLQLVRVLERGERTVSGRLPPAPHQPGAGGAGDGAGRARARPAGGDRAASAELRGAAHCRSRL